MHSTARFLPEAQSTESVGPGHLSPSMKSQFNPAISGFLSSLKIQSSRKEHLIDRAPQMSTHKIQGSVGGLSAPLQLPEPESEDGKV